MLAFYHLTFITGVGAGQPYSQLTERYGDLAQAQ
jgi:hypothetical protein